MFCNPGGAFINRLKIVEAIVGNRVSQETELEGLDIPEMGVLGYNGAMADKQSETPMAKQ